MSEISPVSQNAMDIDTLCQNSIALIRYAGGLAVNHINIIELMTGKDKLLQAEQNKKRLKQVCIT